MNKGEDTVMTVGVQLGCVGVSFATISKRREQVWESRFREKDGDPSSHLLSLRGLRDAAEISSCLVNKPG